ncbi:MAG: hypothetical protein D6755_04315 [Anaerolineae bacterium]|nr:MAG: hypothetical protein D6755_04315 [Anaerolineae bacterium]
MSEVPTTSYVLPLTVVRRERTLPQPGRVLVRQGQQVNANTPVAEANLHPEHVLLNVAAALGVDAKKAASWMSCEVGERLMKGDAIAASPKGLFRKVFRSPCDGEVVLVRGGLVLLKKQTEDTTLQAVYPGDVVDIIGNRGVVIENTGALVQGRWGNGKHTFGVLRVMLKSADEEITPDRMDIALRGAVLVGGICRNPEVFTLAAEIPVKGLILSSMPVSLRSAARKAPFPVMLVDGFGEIPMNSAAYDLLSTSDERDVVLHARPFDFYTGDRPEAFFPLSGAGQAMPPMPRELAVEDLVWVCSAPHPGAVGHVVRIFAEPQNFPGGMRAPAAQVRLLDGQQITVPLANLELVR